MKHLLRVFISCVLLWAMPAIGGQWNGGGLLGQVNFDSEAAGREGVETSATSFGGYAEFQTDALVAFSMGGEFILYDDNEEFTQLVEYEDIFGDSDGTGSESSDAMAIHLFADVGPRWKFGGGYLAVAGGFSSAVYSERSISNCVDCYAEDIELDGGGYVKLAGGFKAGVINLGLLYRNFVSGDLDNAIYITIGTGF